MSDLIKMKRTKCAAVSVGVSNVDSQAVPSSEDRVSLILPGSATQTVSWRYGGVATAGAGIFIATGGAAVHLSLLLDGALVKGPWHCITGTGAETLVYHEATNSEL